MATPSSEPPARAEHIGSLLRPQSLKDAVRDLQAGRIDASRFEAIQDRVIAEVVALQEALGFAVVTDGEFRRASWFMGFVDALDGLTMRESLVAFKGQGGQAVAWPAPYAATKLKRKRGIVTGDFAAVRAHAKRRAKGTMPTPSIMHFFRFDEAADRTAYPDIELFWADLVAIYRAELAALAAAGCDYVQLDEVPCAVLCDPAVREAVRARGGDPDRLVDRYVRALNDIITAKPPGMRIGVHFCRGNYKGQWMAAGGYAPIAERMFTQLQADALFLEYDSERAGGFEPLCHVRPQTTVVLGLVSTKTPALESLDTIARRVEAASRVVPLERLALSPQCGFASSAGGNPITFDDQRAKLALVVAAARNIWK